MLRQAFGGGFYLWGSVRRSVDSKLDGGDGPVRRSWRLTVTGAGVGGWLALSVVDIALLLVNVYSDEESTQYITLTGLGMLQFARRGDKGSMHFPADSGGAEASTSWLQR